MAKGTFKRVDGDYKALGKLKRQPLADAHEVLGKVRAHGITEFRSTILHWRDPPAIVGDIIRVGNRRLTLIFYLRGTELQTKKWRLLNWGTSVRYATMSKGFIAKTSPNRRHSIPGLTPDPVYVSKLKPRPGIEARRWTQDISEELDRLLEGGIYRVLQKKVT
jgi:hypothetical protein